MGSPPALFRMGKASRQERREVASGSYSFPQSYSPVFPTEAIHPVLLPKMSPTNLSDLSEPTPFAGMRSLECLEPNE